MDERVPHERTVQVRVGENLFSALESWRRGRIEIPTRSQAIRELLQKSLAESDRDGVGHGS